MSTIKKINETVLWSGKVMEIKEKTFEDESGNTFTREIAESSPVVHILPITTRSTVLAINEFRGSIEKTVLGFPAGKIDKGETPQESAIREIEEEIGKKVIQLVPIANSLYSTMGISNEIGYYYMALVDDFKEGEQKHFKDNDEYIETVELSFADMAIHIFKQVASENGEGLGLKTVFMWLMFVMMNNTKEPFYETEK